MKKGWRKEETRQRERGQSREGGDKGDPEREKGREETIEGRARERRERKK